MPRTVRINRRVRKVLGGRRVRHIKARRLRWAERLGLSRWTTPGLDGLDVRVCEMVKNAESHTFVEFGANDGLQQSNTYVLERDFGWRGVLIEPIGELVYECIRNRPLAKVVGGCVSSRRNEGQPISFVEADLVSQRGSGTYYAIGLTLTAIIDHVLAGPVGLVSIDIEGSELEALDGLDLNRCRPEYILVETSNIAAICDKLRPLYGRPVQVSHHDYLFALDHHEH
jgi:hypothetical protein